MQLIQIVNFNQSNSSGVTHTAYNCCVIPRLQVCNDRRLARGSWSMTAVLNVADLTAGDNGADYSRLPIIIASNQPSGCIVQLQCGITQHIGDPKLRKLGAYGTDDDSLRPGPLNDKTTKHYMLARLYKAACADVTKT